MPSWYPSELRSPGCAPKSCMAKTLTPEKSSYCSRATARTWRRFSSESLNALRPIWTWPLPYGGSQFFGSLTPSSPSWRARAAIPTRNASGKLCSESCGNAERLEARVADPDRQPGIGRAPPVRGGIDMRYQPADELAARSASSTCRSTCVPKYGAGLGLSTVAWISSGRASVRGSNDCRRPIPSRTTWVHPYSWGPGPLGHNKLLIRSGRCVSCCGHLILLFVFNSLVQPHRGHRVRQHLICTCGLGVRLVIERPAHLG